MRPIARHSRSTRIVARGAHGLIDYTRLAFAAGTGWLCLAEPLSITTAIRLAAATGWRRGDLVELRWSGIKSSRVERPTNMSRGKAVAICPWARDGGDLIAELRQARQAAVDAGRRPSEHVLVTEKGTPWKPDSLTQAFDRAASGLRIGKTLNDLRGTAATRFSREGFKNQEIATFLGWEPARVDRIITRHVHAETLGQEAIARLEGARTSV